MPLINQFYNWSILIMQYYLYVSELKAFTFTQQQKESMTISTSNFTFLTRNFNKSSRSVVKSEGQTWSPFSHQLSKLCGKFCWKRDHHWPLFPMSNPAAFHLRISNHPMGVELPWFFGTPKKNDGKTLKLNFVSQNSDEKWTFLRRCSRTWWRTVPTVPTARHVCQFQLLELIEPVRTCSELRFFSVQRKMQDPSTPNGYQGVPSRQNVSTCLNASSLIQVMKIGEIHTTTDLSNTSKYPLILWGEAHLDFHQECLVLVGITLIWIVE